MIGASDDSQASKLVTEVGTAGASPAAYFLGGGARSGYLALELPAPMFSTKPPPYGYASALKIVQRWLVDPKQVGSEQVEDALAELGTLDFRPGQLADKTKPKGGAKKKITGGCG